jgi:hypothetical protein
VQERRVLSVLLRRGMTAGLRRNCVIRKDGTGNKERINKRKTWLNASKDIMGRHMGREPHDRKRKRNGIDKPTIRVAKESTQEETKNKAHTERSKNRTTRDYLGFLDYLHDLHAI